MGVAGRIVRGLARRVRRTAYALTSADLVRLEDELQFKVDPTTEFGRELLDHGVRATEAFVVPLMRRVLREGDVFMDVGAHWGLYSILAARQVGPRGCVVSVEPYAPSRRRLQGNVRLNGLTNVTILPCAVGPEAARATLRVEGSGDNLNRVIASGESPEPRRGALDLLRSGPRAEACEVRPLAGLLDEAPGGPITLMKMDVEGGEWKVAGDLGRHGMRIEVLFIEVHPRWSDVKDEQALYEALGFGRSLLVADGEARRMRRIDSLAAFREALGLYYFVSVAGASRLAVGREDDLSALTW